MILESGVKVLVTHRRLFEGDHTRTFIGTVEGYENGIARVSGYTWIRDGYQGDYRRKADKRTKIFALSSGTVIFYQLPGTVDIERLTIETKLTNVFAVEGDFRMDLTEGVLHAGGRVPGSQPFGRTA